MKTDRLLGATAIAVAAMMLVFGYALQAPFAYEPVGPRAFPLIAAGMIALCGVILVLRPGEPSCEPAGPIGALAALCGCLVGYALLFQPLGFVIATTIFMVPIAMIFGAKWWQGAVTGVVLAVSSYLLFDRVLEVVLPVGPFGGIV
ncbi:putative tricarboxylic transport membrane protein [Neorhizobium sp. R1-B]|jgi:putative tricarboxylic transport membrane protein|uniref:tripartite tricarboxylate transporter TctB family protein n=1 Tax=Neorhizobium sp. R1-B TaxID=2485162 RepID=UPI001064FB15|nr:tripartite tricarboxylate transporter TctB family protein [Neorhizobium sp. R1-B]TDX83619.1 putative tricarboxylic transport membrane protein [Neorhizobium sp. R1-B]